MPVSSNGVTYWYFGRSTRTYTSSVGLTSWLFRHTAEFDLVHIHSVFSFPATVSAAIARLKSVPYVVRPLGVLNRWGLGSGRAWAKRLSIRWIESGILRRAAAVQFSSMKERAETAEVCALGKTAVIANPVEFDPPVERGLFRALYPSIGGRRIVLFLARLDPVKGIELLLDAFRIVREANPQVVLAIAGSGDPGYQQTLRARAERLGIAADVIWTGFLDRTAKAQALADADVFVVPSQSESFGLAAVEALAAGVPTVMTNGVGIADEVASNGAGIIVPANSRALASAIERILIAASRWSGPVTSPTQWPPKSCSYMPRSEAGREGSGLSDRAIGRHHRLRTRSSRGALLFWIYSSYYFATRRDSPAGHVGDGARRRRSGR
jgi:glycosyltransferase involved in cell wall biosynthesis